MQFGKNKWCDNCQQIGHRKWLWLGTHKTHRLYLRWRISKFRMWFNRG